ncbi:hypothetical protein GCM10027051_36240 [Niabella terrae]
MKSLKLNVIMLLMMALPLLTVSCKKDKVEKKDPAAKVVGSWDGIVNISNSEYKIALEVSADKSIKITSQSTTLDGTWTLAENNFKAKFVVEGVTGTLTTIIDENEGSMEGLWTEENNGKVTHSAINLSKK